MIDSLTQEFLEAVTLARVETRASLKRFSSGRGLSFDTYALNQTRDSAGLKPKVIVQDSRILSSPETIFGSDRSICLSIQTIVSPESNTTAASLNFLVAHYKPKYVLLVLPASSHSEKELKSIAEDVLASTHGLQEGVENGSLAFDGCLLDESGGRYLLVEDVAQNRG